MKPCALLLVLILAGTAGASEAGKRRLVKKRGLAAARVTGRAPSSPRR